MSELFTDDKNTLLRYSFMFGPDMKSACSSCTSILDGLNGQSAARHAACEPGRGGQVTHRADRESAKGRGWNNLRLLSSAGNTYNQRLLTARPTRVSDPDDERLYASQRRHLSHMEQRTVVPPLERGVRTGATSICCGRCGILFDLRPKGEEAPGIRSCDTNESRRIHPRSGPSRDNHHRPLVTSGKVFD